MKKYNLTHMLDVAKDRRADWQDYCDAEEYPAYYAESLDAIVELLEELKGEEATMEIRHCEYCGEIMTEGYLAEWSGDTYCTLEHAKADLDEVDYTDGLEDGTLFWTTWLELDTVTAGDWHVVEGFRIHDSLFFSEAKAELFNDGKDRVERVYVLLEPTATATEGEQLDNYRYYATREHLDADIEELGIYE